MRVTASTRIAGVVGAPARHSLSPVIHNAWIEAAGLDAVYLAFEPAKERFGALVDGLRGGVALGLNVTIPFKEEALALADEADPAARAAGAANLLLFRPDGAVVAENWDGAGLIHALARKGVRLEGARVVLVGAGGAARGAAQALLASGVGEIVVLNRTPERAAVLARIDGRISPAALADAGTVLARAEVLINATSLGMDGQPPLDLPLEAAPLAAVVMDMVYRPLDTPLLQAARSRGHPVCDGLDMLIGQAIPSFRSIFGRDPPGAVDVRGLCERALGGSP